MFNEQLDALLKCLILFYQATQQELTAEQRKVIADAATPAKAVLKKLSLPKDNFSAVCNHIVTHRKWGEILDYDVSDLAIAVKTNYKEYQANHDITATDLSFLKDFQLAVLKDSQPAINRLFRNIEKLGSAEISSMFVEEAGEKQSKYLGPLKNLVRKLTGKNAYYLTVDQRDKLSKSRETEYKEYLKLHQELRKIYKKVLANIVRTSGKPYLPVLEVKKKLKAAGIELHNIQDGFIGSVDSTGALYTTTGNKIRGLPGGPVTMNTAYNSAEDNAYVFSANAPGGVTTTRYYTLNFIANKKKKRFSRLATVTRNIEEFRDKWLADLNGAGQKQILGCMVEIAYRICARVSSSEETKTDGERTFGLTTWQVKHITIEGNAINFIYLGKAGQKQHHIIQITDKVTRQIKKVLNQLLRGKKFDDYVFVFANKRLSRDVLTHYLKGLGLNATIHDFRRIRGTELAIKLLADAPFKKGKIKKESDVHNWLKEEMKKVGQDLGHFSGEKVTGMTAMTSYTNPQVLADFYEKLGLRVPPFVQRILDAMHGES